MNNITNQQIIEYIKKMTLIQLKELIELIEITFQVNSKININSEAENQKTNIKKSTTTLSLILKEIGDKKIDVIKTIKLIIGNSISLLEAKKIVDKVTTIGPQIILDNIIDINKAKEYEEQLKINGAVVEIK